MNAFVLISFEDAYTAVYEELIKKPLEGVGFSVERADSRLNQQSILRDVVVGIANADLVVADLTGLNPNVFYELGIAHALEVPTILLTQDIDELPFDLRAYRANEYSTHFSDADAIKKTIAEIGAGRASGTIVFGSPVTDFLPPGERRKPAAAAVADEHDDDKDDKAAADQDDDAAGLLDFLMDAEQASEELASALVAITESTEAVGASLESESGRLQEIGASGAPNSVKLANVVALRAADQLNGYASALEGNLAVAEPAAEKLMESVAGYVDLLVATPDPPTDRLAELRASSEELLTVVRENGPIMVEFRESVASLRGFSRHITTASARVIRSIDRLVSLLGNVEAQASRVLAVTEPFVP